MTKIALRLRALDRRTVEARFIADATARWTNFVGGSPTESEKELINRAAMLSLKIQQMDRKILATEDFSEHDSNYYLSWVNSLAKILKMLPQRAETVDA